MGTGYRIQIKGSGISDLTEVFENAFESSLKKSGAGRSTVTYDWSRPNIAAAPAGYQKVLDILQNATMNRGPAKPVEPIGPGIDASQTTPVEPGGPLEVSSSDTRGQQITLHQRAPMVFS